MSGYNVRTTYDNSRRLPSVNEKCRERTISLRFDEIGDRLRLTMECKEFKEDGAGGLEGWLACSKEEIEAAVLNMCATWDNQVISYRVNQQGKYPFQKDLDVSKVIPIDDQRTMIRKLAREGRQLFWNIFRGNEGMEEIYELLNRALRGGEQIIRIRADMLFVPWAMLYTPADPDVDLESPGTEADPAYFWGYRHLIEHVTERDRGFDSRLCLGGDRPLVGMNVDPRLDEKFPDDACVQPMIDFFQARTRRTDVRADRPTLARAFSDGILEDEICYFGLHAAANRFNGMAPTEFRLGDGDPVRTTDLRAWLNGRRLAVGPVIFFNSCKGGRLGSLFYPSFGQVLLGAGANCLIGPQVDVTPRFAREYAERFFKQFFEHGTRVGDVIQGLAQRLLNEYANPLGLAISLYRGLDTHLAPQQNGVIA